MSSQALCVKLSVLFGVVCHYFNTKRTDMASKQQQAFRMCVFLCLRLSERVGIHTFFLLPVWERRRALAVSTAMCFPCGRSDPAWHSLARTLRLAFPWLWSHCCRGTAKAAVLWFAKGSVSWGRDGHCLFSAFIWQVQCLVSGFGCTCCGFFRPDRGTDTATIWFWGIICCKCQCKGYWGLATLVSC